MFLAIGLAPRRGCAPLLFSYAAGNLVNSPLSPREHGATLHRVHTRTPGLSMRAHPGHRRVWAQAPTSYLRCRSPRWAAGLAGALSPERPGGAQYSRAAPTSEADETPRFGAGTGSQRARVAAPSASLSQALGHPVAGCPATQAREGPCAPSPARA